MINADPTPIPDRDFRTRMLARSMARGASGSNRRVASWGIALLALAILAACPGEGGLFEGEGEGKRKRNMTKTSRDEVLTVTLPADLHVHRYGNAIQGVSADGRFRVHIEHSPAEMLMKMVGRTKEVLRKRTWDNVSEKHYKHAIELRLKRGGISGKIPERRTIWWVTVGERVLTCDGIAHKDVEHRVDASFRALCQGAKLAPPPPPPPPGADAGDAEASGDVPQAPPSGGPAPTPPSTAP